MDFVAQHWWKDPASGAGRRRFIVAALALLAWAAPSVVFAQADGPAGAGGAAPPPAEERQIITPQTNPTEQYNLPPNFDPDYRPKRTPRSTKVTIDFRQAQLEEVVKFFSGALNRNFIISDSIKTNKTITIISPEAVTLNEAYQAFLAALQMNGLTIVPMGNFLKIVESKGAIVEPQSPFEKDERIPNEARVVTALVPVKTADIGQVQEVVQKFATPDAQIIPYGSTLIITEYASNLRRLRELVERLDRGEAADRVYVYKVAYADATEIADKLQEIFGSDGGTAAARAQPTRRNRRNARRNNRAQAQKEGTVGDELQVEITEIIADERTNQLIIVADRRSFDEIREMIEILDVPTAVGGQIHVKFLEYADAEELSSTLSSLTQGGGQGAMDARARAAAARAARRGTAPEPQGSTVAELLSGEVQITAHTPTNALVVVASPRDFMALENVVDLLDRPRRQVYVEAVIMEIGLDSNRTLQKGFNLGAPADLEDVVPSSAVDDGLIDDTQGLIVGQSNFPGPQSLLQTFLGGTGGSLGLIGPGIELPGLGISLPAFAFLLQATQTDNAVNILSTPAILTMDNEEAEIVVGERVPFLRGLAAGAGGAGGLGGLAGLAGLAGAQNGSSGTAGLGGLGGLAGLTGLGGLVSPIDYEDVGITLRILPQINESNYVKLEVDQEVSDIKGAGGLGAGAPIRTRRNAKTVVLVKDQSTVVIGGLMRDVENETIEKVPFLGDVPLVGFLFRNTSTIKTKQNLVLMLTPYIIESENDLQKIRQRKMEERQELLELFGRRDLRYMKQVNFQKKSGLLDRMRSQITDAVAERDARREAMEAFDQEGPRYRIMGGGDEPEPEQVMEIEEVEEPVMLPSPAADDQESAEDSE